MVSTKYRPRSTRSARVCAAENDGRITTQISNPHDCATCPIIERTPFSLVPLTPQRKEFVTSVNHVIRLTFDMSGAWRQAKLAGRRPLDGGVRRLHPALARHARTP